jgi:hemerythrin HHE cation binding domain-containing protein
VKNLAATRKQRAKHASPLEPHDALVLLAADHAALLGMFRDYERRRTTATPIEKGKLALRIWHLLTIHARIEDEVFYPAAERVLGKKGKTLLVEARVEHDVMKGLVGKLEHLPARNPVFDATIKVLGAHVATHFEAEEGELFALLRHSKIDLAGLGEQLAARQLEHGTALPDKKVFAEARRVLGS